MKKIILPLLGVLLFTFALPLAASAHEHQVFKIGQAFYMFTVGSLNEPVVVDDKTGVELHVMKVSDPETETGTPVTRLETTLKVELQAGDKKKILSLRPAYNDPGSYTSLFIPTVETTYSYHLLGTLGSTPFDATFTCTTGDMGESNEDMSSVKLSPTVTRVHKAGGFGCPMAKADAGFPEPSASTYELTSSIRDAKTKNGNQVRLAGFLGALGTIFGIGGFITARKIKK